MPSSARPNRCRAVLPAVTFPSVNRLPVRLGLLAAATALVALAISGPAQAAQTFTVTNLSDSGVAGDGSLRGEVLAANASAGADTINFAGGLSGTITLSGEGLQIKDPVDLEGPGPGQITVAQSSKKRVIHINLTNPGPVTIAGLHIANGTASGPGGNILNDSEHPASSLTVVNSLITGGTASDYGGGIGGFGASLTLSSTTLSGNHAISGAGAWVGGDTAAISIENSTFAGNIASGFGGGLFIEINHGSAVISGTTFSGNQAHSDAGGVAVSISKGPATIANSTIFGNSSASNGGGGVSLSSSEGPIVVEDFHHLRQPLDRHPTPGAAGSPHPKIIRPGSRTRSSPATAPTPAAPTSTGRSTPPSASSATPPARR